MMIDSNSRFARAIADEDVAAAIAIARDDPGVIDLKLPSSYQYERALHAAVRVDSAELAEIVLDHGVEVDVHDGEGYTPLFLAPERGASLDVVKLLVERGADIHVDNDNPLWSAIWHVSYGFGGMPIVRYLVKQGSRPRGLTHAAEAGKLRIVQVLTELGANLNEVDEAGHTPLDYATGVAKTFMWEQIKKKKSREHKGVEKFLRSQGGKLSAELK
ncbi:Ankyrin repeats (3 copies) [Stieleria maiorica]|uniref:Ankyrin repeats (3 copies) n=1 Tax=Stieleria maiorica TaxID=2795974 RepID=A0A5B9MQW9_9BACT|nr:ankyrin repeat domain-containing protein [Stieleria maiorica]QEG01428.1 Ankyrin repeats (3 copies) [Stieleria maiorica]